MNRTLLFLLLPCFTTAQTPLKWVDPLIGTAPATTESARKHSEAGSELKGQTFPAVGWPFGMTQWTPETRTTENKCISPYYFNDPYITGFRGSHWMSGSCTQDYGSMTIMPFSTNRIDTLNNSPVSRFNHPDEIATPAYYRIVLEDFDIQAELTGTERAGMMRFLFSKGAQNYLMIRANSDENQGKIWYDREHNELAGYNPVHRIYQGWGQPAGFSGYFVIRLDQAFTVLPQSVSPQHLVVSFGNERKVQVKIGTSFTSLEAARHNLDQEISGWDFDLVRKGAEMQAPYLFAMVGDAGTTQKWVRQIVAEEYGTGPGGLSGNEDAGQMSAWLVYSMMGFYPVCPGTDEYVTGIPLFRKITVNLENGNKIIIKTHGNSSNERFFKLIYLNGKLHENNRLSHSELIKGAVLDFKMKRK